MVEQTESADTLHSSTNLSTRQNPDEKVTDEEVANLPPASSTWATTFTKYLPAWVIRNLLLKKSWKTLLKTWLAFWVTFILLLSSRSLKAMGNIAFFALITANFVPPAYPVQLFIVLLSTSFIGLCLGWGLGVAAMRAALAARDQDLLKSTLLIAQESAAGAANPEAVFQGRVFEGLFLDTRSTVVFGVFIALGSGFFAFSRASVPPLIPFSIFGTIALDVFCTIGPLLPVAQYTIINSIAISSSMYAAIGLFLVLFVFPESVNHAYLGAVTGILDKMKTIMQLQESVLMHSPERNEATKEALQGSRLAMLQTYKGLTTLATTIGGEFSWGRWSADDAKTIDEPVLAILSKIVGLLNFLKFVSQSTGTVAAKKSPLEKDNGTPVSSTSQFGNFQPSSDVHILRQYNGPAAIAAEKQHELRLEDVLPVLKSSTSDLRTACVDGLDATKSLVAFVNENRFNLPGGAVRNADGLSSCEARLDTVIERLQFSLDEFKNKRRSEVLQPYEPLLAAQDAQPGVVPMRSLFVCYVFSASVISVAEAVLILMNRMRKLSAKRRRNRMWAPTLLHALTTFWKRGIDDSEKVDGEDEEREEEVGKKETMSYERDPESLPPANAGQKFMASLHSFYKWFGTDNGVFVTRYVIVTIALWLPAVFKTSANIYYKEKGLWALVMAQTSVSVFVGDTLFVFATRLIGTGAGLIFGLLIWYIGAGHGTGNPYGLAASFAVFFVPLSFLRAFSPPAWLPSVIIMNATVILVVGYSWLDGHLPVLSIGYGWDVAWRRTVNVLIGVAGAFIVMFVPPKTGRKAVRERNATVLSSLCNVYSSLMSAWISNKSPSASENDLDAQAQADPFRRNLMAVAAQVTALKGLTETSRWEGSWRGQWPYADYARMVEVELEMIATLGQLGAALAKLDSRWRTTFLHDAEVANPDFIADVIAMFSLLSFSIRTGQPMHAALPDSLLDRLLYHQAAHSQRAHQHEQLQITDQLREYDYMFYASAVIAIFQLMQGLDDLHTITKRLCGEVPFGGFERWKADYQRVHGGQDAASSPL
ncbi:hypothetical protein OF83DRAFT_1053079 [Amylostereum chailletii]|nr:hypothetical protein OF83DRAFT_1053079 [Amylostereum chailletii]